MRGCNFPLKILHNSVKREIHENIIFYNSIKQPVKVLDDGNLLEIRFFKDTLKIHRKKGTIEYNKKIWKFSDIKGFWKNYRFKGKKKVYYVIMLTNKSMERITPETDEYDIDEIINYLRKILGDDKYAR